MSSYHPFLSFAAVTGREGTKTYSFPLLPCNAVQTLFSAQLYFSVLPIIIPEGEMAMLSGGNVLLPAVLIICQWPGGEGTNTHFYPLQCTAIPIPTSLPIPIAGLYHLQVTIRGNQNLLFYQMQFSISTVPCNCSGKDKSWMEKLHIGRYADHRISECTSASHGNGDRNVMSPPPLSPFFPSSCLQTSWQDSLVLGSVARIARRQHPCNRVVRQVTTWGPWSVRTLPWQTCRPPSRTPGSSPSPSEATDWGSSRWASWEGWVSTFAFLSFKLDKAPPQVLGVLRSARTSCTPSPLSPSQVPHYPANANTNTNTDSDSNEKGKFKCKGKYKYMLKY